MAEQAEFDPYKIHVDNPEDGPHILRHDPESVLRLCRAHRDLIDEREKAVIHLRWTMANGGGEYDARRDLARWDQVLSIVARGLGVEETTDGQ